MFNIRMSISIVVTGLALYACAKEPAATQSQVERGKYLVTFGGCHDCHTPKIAGPDGMPVLALSGHLPVTADLPLLFLDG
jgi:mono/diheme cytochrome c family protein